LPTTLVFDGSSRPKPDPSLRTVAILDVLGFRRMVETLPLDQLAWRYEQSLHGVREFLREGHNEAEDLEFRREVRCDRYIFSDTVVLISTDENEGAALDVLLCAWRLSQWFISVGLPLRGGVSFGELYTSPVGQVFLGKALTSAHQLEQQQQWIGTAIDPSVVNQFPNLFQGKPDDLLSGLLPAYDVPMKDGTTVLLHTVNWRAQFVALKGVKSLLPEASDKSSADKIAHTLAYAKEMRGRGFAFRRPYPHRLAPVVVGQTDPPPPGTTVDLAHGDEF